MRDGFQWNNVARVCSLIFLALFVHFITYGLNEFGPYVTPLLWVLFGLVFCFLQFPGIYRRHNRNIGRASKRRNTSENIVVLSTLSFFSYLVYHALLKASRIFSKFPIDYKLSDVIPTLQFYVRRLLSGEEVYTVIKYPEYDSVPTYLPMTWLPYIPAELFDFDYRWIPIVVFLGLSIYIIYRSICSNLKIEWLATIILFIGVIFHGLVTADEANMGFALEFLPSSYYIIFCMCLFSKRPYVIAAGLLCCLLSRYSLVFWVPVLAVVLIFERGWRFTIKTGLYTAMGIILLFIIPFVGFEFHKITDILKFINANAASKWIAFGWQPEGAIPYHLKQGYGLTLFFYDAYQNSIEEGISVIRSVQMVAFFLVNAITLAIYFIYRKRIKNIALFLVTSLMVYLLLLYAFQYAPYGYLYFIPATFPIGLLWCHFIRPENNSYTVKKT